MAWLLGNSLTDAPVSFVVTVPGKNAPQIKAALCELIISFIMITMALNTSAINSTKKYTRIFAAVLVFSNVIFAGPVSGFGMNPARSFASAFPANTWAAFWIYVFCPIIGMMSAAELFLLLQKHR